MSIYDVDYTIVGPQLLPPDKRRTRMLAWIKALLSPLQYNRNNLFASYKQGSTDPQYAGGTYNKGDRVIYFFSVYESLIPSNASLPTDANSWMKIQENFVGVDERIRYRGQKIILEYALNKWFNTQFRQPPSISDIYISPTPGRVPVFRSAGVEQISSVVYLDNSSEFIIDDYTFALQANFTIYMPVSIFNALSSNPSNREGIVRNFVDRYVTAGILYQIVTY